MAYNAYDRFINSSKKFPRWTNIRRRPTESNAGKILRSIMEENENVNDAILDYKKEFFIKNYLEKEDDILAYIYSAQVGDIDDIDNFKLIDPAYEVTDNANEFNNDYSLALLKDGYILLYETNYANKLEYQYNGYTYFADLKRISIWNIFDEFAWWCGLERFDGEENKSLCQRCISQLHERPNSTKQGIINAIVNAAWAAGGLSANEVHFLEPNETNMSLSNKDGETLYEEVSQVNRDIARTRKWDLDYWSNAFRKLRYLPHVWDANVDIYKNGVGYNDSLRVTTIKDIDQESYTNVEIKGYIQSEAEVEAYIRNHDIRKDIALTMTRYNDDINPVSVQYRVVAEDLVPISNPDQIKFNFYKQYVGNKQYYIDSFLYNENNAVTTKNNKLSKNTNYTITFRAEDEDSDRMYISKCNLISGGTPRSILEDGLTAGSKFKLINGQIENTAVLFHGSKIADYLQPVNIKDNQNIASGMTLSNPLLDGSINIDLHDWVKQESQPLTIKIDDNSGWNDITSYSPYFDMKGYSWDRTKGQYVSAEGADQEDALFITFDNPSCRDLRLHIDTDTTDEVELASIYVYIKNPGENEELDQSKSKFRINVKNGYDFEFHQEHLNNKVIIKIERFHSARGKIMISNVQIRTYDIKLLTSKGATIQYSDNMDIPVSEEGTILTCVLKNNGNPNSPVIKYIHIGSMQFNSYYSIPFRTGNTDNDTLDIETNCKYELKNNDTNSMVDSFSIHTVYTAPDDAATDIYIDLSSFSNIYETEPALNRTSVNGVNLYYLTLQPGESISSIRINGTGYKLDRTRTLKEIKSIGSGETWYYAKSLNGFVKHTQNEDTIEKISYDEIHFGDKIEIICSNPKIQGRFFVGNRINDAKIFTGAFSYMYLYDSTVSQYIAYDTMLLVKTITDNIAAPRAFSPKPPDNALLSYSIDSIIPNDAVDVYFRLDKDEESVHWSISRNDKLTAVAIELNNPNDNKNIFSTSEFSLSQNMKLSNAINVENLVKQYDASLDPDCYIITPPDKMEIIYSPTEYKQVFSQTNQTTGKYRKLYHSNVLSIQKLKIAGITYSDDEINNIVELMEEEGILCWKDDSPIADTAKIQEIEYTYNKPMYLSFTNIQDLYSISGYKISAVDCVNKEDYIVSGITDGDSFNIDYTYFDDKPTKIIATCENPCYYAVVSGDKIFISKIAEDTKPVIHNGYYYDKDGKEYWFFSNRYNHLLNRYEGIEIENGKVVENNLYVYQKSTNYLSNSKMECNKLDTHCIVDFTRPRIKTNIDPIGHIGACESYSAWEDAGVIRTLTTYKNGYATKFNIQSNGYSILDITPYLKDNSTISCLYSEGLTFTLGREIRILNQQALKTVYCEPYKNFETYRDVAYCTPEKDLDKYRYYLIVQGDGILDEVLIHNFTNPEDIYSHHTKAIDKIGFNITEKNTAKEATASIEYSPLFMRYNNLETTSSGILRTGSTIDWNITKLHTYDLTEDVIKTNFLARNNSLIAQANEATIETKPVEVQYRKSVDKAAFIVNHLIQDNYAEFNLYVYSSKTIDGTYKQIGRASNNNIVSFGIDTSDRFIKLKIVAKENKIINNIEFFLTHKESRQESLDIAYQKEGSAVTKVFNIGAIGDYKFLETVCEDGYKDYQDIYIRSAKQTSSGEYVWSTWSNTAANPEFYNCQLFQFKILMTGRNSQLKIKEFKFEVL